MDNNQFSTIDSLDYYKNQIYKMLGLFESKDKNGYKHAIKIRAKLDNLPHQFPQLYQDLRLSLVITNLDILIEELIFMDGEHQYVANHVFESMNLLDNIEEGLR